MCPDKQLLSMYYDNELPDPFKERIVRHIASCTHCAQTLAGFRRLSDELAPETPLPVHAMEKARENIRQCCEEAAPVRLRNRALPRRNSFWHRKVRLPLPAACAAAVVFILMFTLVLSQILVNGKQQPFPLFAENLADFPLFNDGGEALYREEAANEPVNLSDFRDVLQFLENDGDSNVIIIKLPESKNFNRYSEPRLINTSDHPRNPGGRGP